MTTNTPISSLTYPNNNDQPNVPSHIQGLAEDLDSILIPRFADSTARDAAITAPVDGQHCFLTSATSGGLYVYRNSYAAWHRTPIISMKAKSADETRTNTTTFTDDNHLTGIAYKANTLYHLRGMFYVSGDAAGDFKLQWVFSSAPQTTPFAGQWCMFSAQGQDQEVLNVQSVITNSTFFGTGGTGVLMMFIVAGYFFSNASTAGTMKLQWAQNTSNATATTLFRGSYIQLIEAV